MVTMQQIADRCGCRAERWTAPCTTRRACARKLRSASARRRAKWAISQTVSSCSRRSSGRSAWYSTPAIRPSCRCCASCSRAFPSVSFSQTSRSSCVRCRTWMMQHQLTLIDELVTTEHIDGLRAYAAREHARARQDQHAQRAAGHPCRDIQHGHHRCGTASPMSARDNIASGVMPPPAARHGHAGARQRAADSGSAQRTLCRLAAFYRLLAPKWRRVFRISGFCTRNARSSMKAFPSASLCAPFSRTASCAASYPTSAGREGVYRAVHAAPQ